jgi:hypothetical protein
MTLPDPILTSHDGFTVLRDDLLPGGTKRRAIHVLFDDRDEYVYPSPVFGYAQLALAYACRDVGKRATITCAKRFTRHPLTNEAEQAGAKIIEVPNGYLNVIKARARDYCAAHGAVLLPFGLDTPRFIEALAAVARALPVVPTEVWSVAGSGVLTRSLQLAWPEACVYAVRVGREPLVGRAKVFTATEAYEQDARHPPPFPSCSHYDAKAWNIMTQYAKPGAFFWNVGR